jgi:hypothetical protein
VIDDMKDALPTLERVLALDRGRVRRRFEERFCVNRMARDNVRVYERLIGESDARPAEHAAPVVAAKPNGGRAAH